MYLDTDQPQSALTTELDRLLQVEPDVRWPAEPLSNRVTRLDVVTLHVLVIAGVLSIVSFCYWFFGGDHVGAPWLYWPLTLALVYKLLLILYEWLNYLGVRPRTPPPPPCHYTVDVLTTWCPGEPREMVVATLKSILRLNLPHTTYLCDEGNDPLLRAVCQRLGVRHVTRSDRSGAKAGNINNALKEAEGEITVIMDPDHQAAPYFLERVLGYFQDPQIGFVQCVQGYYNQAESLIAKGAAEQTYHFYGPTMTGMHNHGTTQAIGANCVFRRKALDSIGGHAIGLAEDMHTALKLYAKGWKSVYLPEVLTRGLTPNTFHSYVKQQLKWACGVWDILIETYWRVCSRLSWFNRLHFIYKGLFYLRGHFVLLGLLVPIAALYSGAVPWKIELLEFVTWFGPVLVIHLLIRQVAQRWLMEKSERGFHLVGGFLLNASWWVHLSGTTCSMIRRKLPYIPTPKDDQLSDNWRIILPNLAIILGSIFAIIYGLSWDWSPYSLLMATFAVINIIMLGFVTVITQQATLDRIHSKINSRHIRSTVQKVRKSLESTRQGVLWCLRKLAFPLVFIVAGTSLASTYFNSEDNPVYTLWEQMENRTAKASGGFFLGAYVPEADTAYSPEQDVQKAMQELDTFEQLLDSNLSLVSMYQPWGEDAVDKFPHEQLAAIRARGSVPMITWEPYTHLFNEADTDAALMQNQKVFKKILSGLFDDYLQQYAILIREYGHPVFMRFAHEPDNPTFSWSTSGGNTPEEYIAAWRYVVEYFTGMGATNVAWVWSPWKPEAVGVYYPGDHYVDWIGLTILNYGVYQNAGSWDSFSDLYLPFYDKLWDKAAPIMISEFGSTNFGGDPVAWITDAVRTVSKRSEIKGLVFFNSSQDMNWPTDWPDAHKNHAISWKLHEDITLAEIPKRVEGSAFFNPESPRSWPSAERETKPDTMDGKRNIAGTDEWQLLSDGKPFYIRGIAYSAGEGWRSTQKATRSLVEADFSAIAHMGANTVRRYSSNWSDKNILNAAHRNGLKVMMGFWLDHEIDYASDSEALAKIEQHIVKAVETWKDHPAVLSWTIGNETWGQLKHYFTQPYLTEVRNSYLLFVEYLAQRIRSIDPAHPVFTSLEYSAELPGALASISRIAPSIDAVGINSYYDRHLEKIAGMVDYFAGGMPWLASEFGPDGYWDLNDTDWDAYGFATEPSDSQKAAQYEERWLKYIAKHAPRNIGGIAYTWKDRFEGSVSWFGLTDMKGRRKPAFHALKKLWLNEGTPLEINLPPDLTINLPQNKFSSDGNISAQLHASTWPEDCTIEWSLVKEGSYQVQHEGETPCDVREYSIQLRTKPGRYRLHANVVVENDVSGSSTALVVE